MKKMTLERGEERGKVRQRMRDAREAPFQPPVKLAAPPLPPQSGRKSRMPSPPPPRIAGGKMNVWTFLDLSETSSPPRPGVLERPASLGRKQEIPPRWGPGPEVPPMDG